MGKNEFTEITEQDLLKQQLSFENDVREKLLAIMKSNNGELPDRFFLIHIWLNKEQLQDFIDRIGVKASVAEYNYSYSKGHYYVLDLIK